MSARIRTRIERLEERSLDRATADNSIFKTRQTIAADVERVSKMKAEAAARWDGGVVNHHEPIELPDSYKIDESELPSEDTHIAHMIARGAARKKLYLVRLNQAIADGALSK